MFNNYYGYFPRITLSFLLILSISKRLKKVFQNLQATGMHLEPDENPLQNGVLMLDTMMYRGDNTPRSKLYAHVLAVFPH